METVGFDATVCSRVSIGEAPSQRQLTTEFSVSIILGIASIYALVLDLEHYLLLSPYTNVPDLHI
jgi:hypothetical protein